VAGLFAAVVVLSVAPLSHRASHWIAGNVASILSRAELAARYLVIVQARLLAVRHDSRLEQEDLLDYGLRTGGFRQRDESLGALRERLDALRAVLEDLPRYGLRLLRRAEKQVRRLSRAKRQSTPHPDSRDAETLCAQKISGSRIERPPDKSAPKVLNFLPPSGFRREVKAVEVLIPQI
jgi:hypothetical protein